MDDTPPEDQGLTPPGPPLEQAPYEPPRARGVPRAGGPSHEDRLATQQALGRPTTPRTPPPVERYNGATSRTMAGWALALSLLVCIPFGFLVAIGLAIAVLVRSSAGGDHGRGRAIAALVVSGLILVANVVYAGVVIVDVWRNGWDDTARDDSGRVTESGLVSIDRLRRGDCVSDFQTTEEVEAGARATGEAMVVPCARPHVSEVFAIVPIDPTAYVDQPSLDHASTRACLKPFREYVGRSFQRSVYELNYYNPAVDGASLLQDEVVCMVTDPDGPRSTVMKGTAR